jgi:hypothetical protein
MVAINTGYTSPTYSPAAVTSAPTNFGPGQLRTDTEQSEGGQGRIQEAAEKDRKNNGFTTPTRGNTLNITV